MNERPKPNPPRPARRYRRPGSQAPVVLSRRAYYADVPADRGRLTGWASRRPKV